MPVTLKQKHKETIFKLIQEPIDNCSEESINRFRTIVVTRLLEGLNSARVDEAGQALGALTGGKKEELDTLIRNYLPELVVRFIEESFYTRKARDVMNIVGELQADFARKVLVTLEIPCDPELSVYTDPSYSTGYFWQLISNAMLAVIYSRCSEVYLFVHNACRCGLQTSSDGMCMSFVDNPQSSLMKEIRADFPLYKLKLGESDTYVMLFDSYETCVSFAREEGVYDDLTFSPAMALRVGYMPFSYSTRVDTLFDFKPSDNPVESPTTGVELETSWYDADELDKAFRAFYAKEGFDNFIVKSDGSIRGVGGEIVSKPMERETQKAFWVKMFEHLNSEPYKDQWNSDSQHGCGCHIHMGRDAVSQLTLSKMLVFLNSKHNRKFIRYMAGRGPNKYQQYEEKHLDSHVGRGAFRSNRYEAINLRNEGTIEFRIFTATKDINRLLASIDFVYALHDFCKKVNRYRLSAADFLAWLERHKSKRDKYPDMMNLLYSRYKSLDPSKDEISRLINRLQAGNQIGQPTSPADVARIDKAHKNLKKVLDLGFENELYCTCKQINDILLADGSGVHEAVVELCKTIGLEDEDIPSAGTSEEYERTLDQRSEFRRFVMHLCEDSWSFVTGSSYSRLYALTSLLLYVPSCYNDRLCTQCNVDEIDKIWEELKRKTDQTLDILYDAGRLRTQRAVFIREVTLRIYMYLTTRISLLRSTEPLDVRRSIARALKYDNIYTSGRLLTYIDTSRELPVVATEMTETCVYLTMGESGNPLRGCSGRLRKVEWPFLFKEKPQETEETTTGETTTAAAAVAASEDTDGLIYRPYPEQPQSFSLDPGSLNWEETHSIREELLEQAFNLTRRTNRDYTYITLNETGE